MTKSWRYLLVVGGLLLAGGAWLWWTELPAASHRGDGPHRGTLAPLDPELSEPWEEVMDLTPALLSKGPIRAVAALGDTVLVAQGTQWLAWVEGELVGPFGSGAAGSPDWIGGADGIALMDGRVVLLDPRRRQLSFWTLTGERQDELPLPSPSGAAFFPDRLGGGKGGHFLTGRSVPLTGGGEWMVLQVASGPPGLNLAFSRPITSIPGSGFDVPIPLLEPDGSLQLGRALGWTFERLSSSGEVLDSWVRPAGPLWAVPDSVRQRARALMSQVPSGMSEGMALPEFLPVLRALEGLSDGRRLALVVAGPDDAHHVEVLNADFQPIGRLWEKPLSDPIWLSDGWVFRVVDRLESTTILRKRIRQGATP